MKLSFELQLFAPKAPKVKAMQAVSSPGRGWWRIWEAYPGAWQQNVVVDRDTVLAYHAVYACITLISSDVGKLRQKLVEQDASGIWSEIDSPAFSPVLKKPNHYQNYIQFKEWWITSKLIHGNAYCLLQRDARGVVVAQYLLDPTRVVPAVSDSGDVFYQLKTDNLSGLATEVTVPAREIIHDRMNCLFHPLIGTSPIFACGVAAMVGLNIQNNSSTFFSNGSLPSGVLSAPGSISDETAQRLKEHWDTNFSGVNAGKVAVLGDNLKFEPMRMSAVDSQLIDQLKWSAEIVCSCFHVPAFKIGIGQMPTYQNAEILNQIYYSDCLQSHIESYELCQDEGLGLTEVPQKTYGVELDLDGLLRMDTATQVKTLTEGIGGGLFAPNEARRKVDLKPLPGGNTVYLQQQEFSLAALDKRDTSDDPFGSAKKAPPAAPTTPALPAPDTPPTPKDYAALRREFVAELTRHLHARAA